MSEQHPTTPEPTAAPTAATIDTVPAERVVRGLLLSLVAVLGGVVLAVVIWRAGYIASLSSLVIAAGAVALYQVGAGAPPRRGLVPVLGLVVLGVVLSFFAVVASDLWDAWSELTELYGADAATSIPSRGQFIRDNITNGDLLSEYGKDGALFALFAALGVFGTLRRLFSDR